jgi:predicted amidophosphoribosyltransferase
MKNIVNIDTKVVCWHCDKKGFYSFEFSRMTCPRCEKQTDEEDTNGNCFCEDCGIMFDAFGCSHEEEKFNAHFISKYAYEGIIYNGMPLFESLEEWKNKIGDIMILKWVCPNEDCLEIGYHQPVL